MTRCSLISKFCELPLDTKVWLTPAICWKYVLEYADTVAVQYPHGTE
ncbi:hypothetical protein GO283_05076 [Ralstonia solanacearum]|nr:hypothetical protein [Ralstonia solanacearum]NKA91508.1 hypothetical protein [Ralstonia solanacearum]NKA96518.1 hypothetical protein [Ralstonia solanacearum]NKF92938.1 hypothetical protein [Ralstonia solanacearum]NKF98117.1 hypothetical protein [Ralstonia solanacearum]